MGTKIIETVLSTEVKIQLENLVTQYHESNQRLKSLESSTELLKATLKTLLNENELTKFETTNGIKVSLTTSSKITFDEELLLDFAKQTEIPELVKTKEYVDMNILEDALYHKDINAEDLIPFKKEVSIVRLNCRESKKTLLTE